MFYNIINLSTFNWGGKKYEKNNENSCSKRFYCYYKSLMSYAALIVSKKVGQLISATEAIEFLQSKGDLPEMKFFADLFESVLNRAELSRGDADSIRRIVLQLRKIL